MNRTPFLGRLSVRLTLAFLLASVMGVALVAVLAYRSTSSDLSALIGRLEEMDRMMGGAMGRGMGGMMGVGGSTWAQVTNDFLNNLWRDLWIAGLSGVALAILLGAVFTRQIVAPVGRVAAAARRVASGDLAQQVDVRGAGEVAELGDSFNYMVSTLKQDQELRHNMVADIAHELRTPLSVLRGNVEAMIDGVLPANTENLNSLHQETLLLSRLVDDLRTLSLAEAGQLSLECGPTDLKAVAAGVIDGFRTQAASGRVALELESPDGAPIAWVDSDRTAQVLRNLLANALHYTPEGGRITVRLIRGAEGVTVSVSDTGVGIPEKDLSHVFERFYRVDRSRTRSTGGSGLGLAIVKQLVEAQGGRVWAESVPGNGATFSFRVPGATTNDGASPVE